MQMTDTSILYGLSAETIEKIQAVFKAFPQIEQATIYGSRAKGSAEVGSDIDLTIIGDELTEQQMIKVEMALDELMLPYTIDLSDLDKIKNQELIDHIKRVGKLFYQR